MKKGVVFVFFLFFFALGLVRVSAEANCSDGSAVIRDVGEVDLGSSRVINGLGIGATQAQEGSRFRQFSADLLLDSRRLSLTNQTSSETINLLSGGYTISMLNASSSFAKISIGGESASVDEGAVATIKGLFVYLSDAEATGPEGANVRLVVGAQKLSLSEEQNPSEKVTFGNLSYVVELSSASSTNVIVEVQRCATGDISEVVISTTEQTTSLNQTTNQTLSVNASANVTLSNQSTNGTGENVSVSSVTNDSLNVSANNSINGSEGIIPPQKREGFFRRLIAWLKSLFG